MFSKPTKLASATPKKPIKKRYLVLAAGVLLLLAGLIFGALSPVAALNQVDIEGVIGKQAESVRQAANLQDGTPLFRINENEVAARVQDVTNIAAVQVTKSWPNTVRILVVERVPVAKAELGAQQWEIIDATGQTMRTTKKLPKYPTLQAQVGPPFSGQGRIVGAQIIAALPPWLLKRIDKVVADDPQNVVLVTSDSEKIAWGTPEESELKAAVLRILLKEKGMYWFDVRDPNLPTVAQSEPQPPKPHKKKDKPADSATPSPSPSGDTSVNPDGASTDPNSFDTIPDSGSTQTNEQGKAYLLP